MIRTTLLIALLLGSTPAWADEVRSYQPGTGKVPAGMIAPQGDRFKNDEGYFETWMMMLHVSGGDWVQCRFILTNVGPGDGHGALDLMRFGAPLDGDTSQKRVFGRWIDKIEKSVRSVQAKPLDVKFRNSRLLKTKRGYTLLVNAKGYEMEVELKNRGPHWRPGNGEATFPGGGRFGIHYMPTLAVFKGRERLNGGEWRDIKGTAWGEHGFTNVMAHKLSNRFLRFHGRHKGYAVVFNELFTSKNFGEERMGFLVVTKGSEVVASGLVARSDPDKFKKDPRRPNHRVPINYVVKAPTEGGELSLVVKVGAPIYREDVLGTIPDWVRRVVQMFIQPINYYNRAQFQLTLPNGEVVKGRGVSLYSPMKAKN